MDHVSNSRIGRFVIRLDEVTSTNQVAEQYLSKRDPIEGTVIMAAYQTAGRGQYDREWHSDRGKNLTLSVIIFPEFLNIKDQFALNMLCSVSLVEWLNQVHALQATIKWPNDIYIGRRKIAGILIKNFLGGGQIKHTIMGLGINLNQSHFGVLRDKATSIFLEKGQEVDVNHNLDSLLKILDKYYRDMKTATTDLSPLYLSNLMGLNEIREFDISGTMVKGKLCGLDAHGRMLVEIGNNIRAFDHNSIRLIV